MSVNLSQLSPSLLVYHGCCNTGILCAGEHALLIDCGDGAVRHTLATLGIRQIDAILFTHHHRDSTSGAIQLAQTGTRIGVPALERPWFAAVETFWADPQMRWHLYNIHPHNLMLAESIAVHDVYQDGDQFQWGAAKLTVFATPGHTDGSVSYLVEVDGQRFIFCGDALYAPGQLWDLYSLQKQDQTPTDYHGFLGDRKRLLQSLDKLVALQPHALIPTHGAIMREPAQAVELFRERLAEAYDKYVAISALRHYFPWVFTDFAERTDHMSIRAGKPVPDFLRHIGTSWIVIAENKEALVMDCGSPEILQGIQQLQINGEIAQVTTCWVTHYHDDHVDALPEFQAAFPCPTYADPVVADVIENPRAFRLACISPAVARIDHRTQDGESWTWNEFRLTAYTFPGQTYYHGGLLVEGHGLRLFFSGDSFTMAGIDDYCMGNRNLLGAGVGYDRCLARMAELQPTHIFNCHVNVAFDFTLDEIAFMRANLAEREKLYTALVPWDHANYGLDEHWVRCMPYEQDVVAGQTVHLRVAFTNHSAVDKIASCRPILPKGWERIVPEQQTIIPAKQDGSIHFRFSIPHRADDDLLVNQLFGLPGAPPQRQPKRIVIPVEVTYDGRPLGQFREAIFVLHPKPSTKMKELYIGLAEHTAQTIATKR
ncbi:MAG: MBL fold metallo-hydrolase [Caldilineaceae bacterium]